MVMVDDATNKFDSNTLITASMEYTIEYPPEYTKIFSNLHKLG
jgi:hypothetical protein